MRSHIKYIFSTLIFLIIHVHLIAQDSLYVERIENIKPRLDTVMNVPELDSIRLGFEKEFTMAELDSLTKLYGEQRQEGKGGRAGRDSLNLFSSGIQFYVDYGKLLTYASVRESKLEAGLGLVVLKRFSVNLEYGMAELDPVETFQNVREYQVEGSYYRVGLDYLFALNENNYLDLGFRYAMSNYSDRGSFVIGSEVWENYESNFGNDDLQATWGEIILTSEKKMLPRLYFGIKLRLRVLIDANDRDDIPVYAIPGYGRYFDKSIPALNLHVKYKIPF